jgi:hypothetical protein
MIQLPIDLVTEFGVCPQNIRYYSWLDSTKRDKPEFGDRHRILRENLLEVGSS